MATTRFEQSFDLDSDGIFDASNGWFGITTEVPSGTDGIASADGTGHSVFEQTGDSGSETGPFTRFDYYRALGAGADKDFTASVKVYLNPFGWSLGEGFDYSVAANGSDGSHLRDFIFHVARDSSTGNLQIGSSNNTDNEPREDIEGMPGFATVMEAGWYTFEHDFREAADGTLEVGMRVIASDGTVIYDEVIATSDSYADDFGGNRYGWFTNIDVSGGILVDSASLTTADENPVMVLDDSGQVVATFTDVDAAKAAIDAGEIAGDTARIIDDGADPYFYVSTDMSIQAAIDAAESGATIELADGTHVLSAQLSVDNSVSIVGEGQGATTIETADVSWGILVTADDVTISDLTVDAGATNVYGIKVQPDDTGTPTDSLTGFTLENVTVQGAGRSEIDLNGVDDSSLINVTADGQGTAGVGVALSDSTGITIEDLTTIDNAWGGVGLYSAGNVWEAGTNNITFTGSYSSTGEAFQIYADEEDGTVVENIDLSGIYSEVYVVQNSAFRDGADNRSDDFTMFFGSAEDAVALASSFVDGNSNDVSDKSIITLAADPANVNTDAGTTFYVGDGMSIQTAIDAASDGDTIIVAAGTYEELLTIDKELTIQGEPGAELNGVSMLNLTGWDGTSPLNDFFEANNPNYTGTSGITIDADNVTITGLTITGFGSGISLGNTDGTLISGNTFINNVNGIRKGTTADVTNTEISENSFSQGIYGMTVYAASNGDGSFDNVDIDNNSFSALSEKGMYLEQISNSELEGNTFDDVGNFGRISPPFGGTQGEFGAAIDINLKYGTYENVEFIDTVITNSGNSNQDGAADPGDFGAAISVKIRDDAPSYSSNPADFDGQITFTGGSIDGTSTGVRVGEPGKDNLGPDVTLDGLKIENATEGDIDNATDPDNGGTVTVNMATGQGSIDATASQTNVVVNGTADADMISTGSGDDQITANGGDDVIDGGDGIDTVFYSGSFDDFSAGAGSIVLTDENGADGDEGVDTLTNVEIVEFGDGTTVRVAGNGSEYATIQAAIDAAEAGDVVYVAAGTYSENLVIDKAITLIGADGATLSASSGYAITLSGDLEGGSVEISGLDISGEGTATRGISVDAGVDIGTLTIEDLSISGFLRSGVWSSDGGTAFDTTLDNLVMRNVEVSSIGTGGTNDAAHVKLFGFAGNATFEDVTFTGESGGTPTAARPDQAIEIIGVINDNGNSNPAPANPPAIGEIVLDGVDVVGEFHKNPIAIFHFSDLTNLDISDLDLSGAESFWGPLFNIDGITNEEIDASGFNITFPDTDAIHTELQAEKSDQGEVVDTLIIGTSANDSIHGKSGNDTLDGADGDDYLYGGNKPGGEFDDGAGDDVLIGGQGDDTLDGGVGLDTAYFEGAFTDYLLSPGELAVPAGANGSGPTGTVLSSIDVSPNYLTVTDTNLANGDEGTDSLYGIEVLEFDDATVLLVGAGGFATIQEAVDAASAGDTILVTSGDYAETVLVGKAVTILGANAGIGADGSRGAETTLTGAFHFGPGADGAVVDGFEVLEGATILSELTTFYVQAGNIQIVNNIIGRDSSGGYAGRGIITATGSAQGLSVDSNSVSGFATGVFINPGSDASITNNNISGNFVGLSNDGPDAADISGNTFENDFEQIGIGASNDPSDLSAFVGTNTFVGEVPEVSIYPLAGEGQVIIGTINDDLFNGDQTSTDKGQAFDGLGGNDLINAGGGDDTLSGGSGDDTVNGGSGSDLIDGGTGTDTVNYSAATGTVAIDLSSNPFSFTLPGTGFAFSTEFGIDGLTSVENVMTGSGSDNIIGSADANTISSGAGDDFVTSGAGDDIVDGGSGGDLLQGEGGNDQLTGGSGDDSLNGGMGTDTLDGGIGTDLVDYSSASGAIEIRLFTGQGSLNEAAGDRLFGIENIVTGDFNDKLIGDAGANVLDGGDGDDVFSGREGDDTFLGGDGADTMFGDAGTDVVDYSLATGAVEVRLFNTRGSFNEAEGDRLYGIENIITGDFNDKLIGDAGANVLDGGDGDDVFSGREGDDTFLSGAGADTMFGDAGTDVVDYTSATGAVEVRLFNTRGSFNEAEGDRLYGIENIVTGDFNDKLIGDAGANVLDGGAGNDFFSGREGDDTFLGGAGSDTMFGDAGTDVVDYSSASGAVEVRLFNTRGSLNEAEGDRYYGIENVITGDFNDKLIGDAGGNVLDGGAGDDFFSGRQGDDTIIGGAGNDTVFGDAGDDLFIFATGDEGLSLLDFTAGAGTDDVISLSFGEDFDTFEEVIAAAVENGDDTLIDFGNGDVLTIANTSIADLHADDFMFA